MHKWHVIIPFETQLHNEYDLPIVFWVKDKVQAELLYNDFLNGMQSSKYKILTHQPIQMEFPSLASFYLQKAGIALGRSNNQLIVTEVWNRGIDDGYYTHEEIMAKPYLLSNTISLIRKKLSVGIRLDRSYAKSEYLHIDIPARKLI